MKNKNLTVGDLKEFIGMLDDDLPVVIPVIDINDNNSIFGFRYVRTAGILEDLCESTIDRFALCFNTATDGQDLGTQIRNLRRDITCKEVLR